MIPNTHTANSYARGLGIMQGVAAVVAQELRLAVAAPPQGPLFINLAKTERLAQMLENASREAEEIAEGPDVHPPDAPDVEGLVDWAQREISDMSFDPRNTQRLRQLLTMMAEGLTTTRGTK